MSEKKKTSKKSKVKKVQAFVPVKGDKHDDVLYARVKTKSVTFFKDEAKKANVSLSVFMDQLADKLRTGAAVKI